MKAPYDDLNFVRELSKYKWCRANLTVIKRFLLTDWSVYGKISVKSRKIGKRNTLKSQKKKKKGYETEKNLNMESDQPEIKVIAPLHEIPPPPTTENIMKTLNNDKEPDENKMVTETDFGKDAKENGNEGDENGQDPKSEEINIKMNDDDDEVQQDTLDRTVRTANERTVNEVLEPVDTLEMRKRNRTVNEIFSPVDDTLESGNRTVNEVLEPKENPKPEENKINDDDDRTVNEIFSPVADLGQDTRNETEKKDTGDPKPKEIRDQGGGWGLEWG